MPVCRTCHSEITPELFIKEDKTACRPCYNARKRQERKRRYAQNLRKILDAHKRWRASRPGWAAARQKAYRERHPENAAASGKAWRQNNPQKTYAAHRRWVEKNRLKVRAYFCEYERLHPDKGRANKQKRLARKRGAGKCETISILAIAERDGWICHLCRNRVSKGNWSLDHLIPLSAGGQHIHENVALAHHLCNTRRGVGRIPAQLRLLP